MDPTKDLALTVNSHLGEAFVKLKLVEQECIDQALPMFNEHLVAGNLKRASLLKVLTWDLDLVEEKTILDYQIEEFNLGYCNPINYEIDRELLPPFTFNECWATMSLPVDLLSGVFFVTTAYFLSEEVKNHWEKRLTPNIFWYLSDLSSLTRALEELEKREEREREGKEEEREEGISATEGADEPDSTPAFLLEGKEEKIEMLEEGID